MKTLKPLFLRIVRVITHPFVLLPFSLMGSWIALTVKLNTLEFILLVSYLVIIVVLCIRNMTTSMDKMRDLQEKIKKMD
jgi:membrane protein insertase Oxa1/YidC/SpoIIIJ